MYEAKLEKEIRCPLEYGLDIFGGKWKSRILCVLAAGKSLRYKDLKTELGNVTDAVLAAMLKELAADGMITRKQYEEIPLRVEYALAEKGESVLPILQNVCLWSNAYYREKNRENFLPPCRNCTVIN
ncbi:MAG: helix-turn-helix transcriptional regulator [Fusobacteriaceae bacterium]|jgi:DNA-binding HxlR family transcriptional regulator|nr:helix-turn-helix transcriptional regulator [Fusobacteriaceae bacterium]